MSAEPFDLDVQYDGQTVVGVDPGSHGALALLTLGRGFKLLEVVDMPIRDRGKTVTVNQLDGRALRRIIQRWQPNLAVVEHVEPMPSKPGDECPACKRGRHQMPPKQAFTFGEMFGIHTALECMGVDVVLVRPQVWKLAAGLVRGDKGRAEVKAASLALAREMWPEGPFERVKDEARAEAALIARYGMLPQATFF